MNAIVIIFIIFVNTVQSTFIINGHDVITRGKNIYSGNGGDNVLLIGNTNSVTGRATVIKNNQITNYSINIENGRNIMFIIKSNNNFFSLFMEIFIFI